MSKDTDFETRKSIFEEIKIFNRTALEELYKVLRRAGEEVSEKRNGMAYGFTFCKGRDYYKNKGVNKILY